MENETQPQQLEPVSDYVHNVYSAIAEIQQANPVLAQNARNPVFGSSYTPLDDVAKRLAPLFKRLGLVCLQPLEDPGQENMIKVRTIIRHIASGTQVESTCVMPVDIPLNKSGKPAMNKQQGAGSSISYARRYSLTSLLGIVCGSEDDDGNAGESNAPNQSQGPPPQQPPPDDQEARFWAWIKTFCRSNDDYLALCAWLAVSEVKDLNPANVKGHPEVQGMIGRAVKRITEQQKIPLDVMMDNARAFYASQNKGA